MSAFQKLFNGHSKSDLSSDVETAVNEVLREAEELRRLLRARREGRSTIMALAVQRNDGT